MECWWIYCLLFISMHARVWWCLQICLSGCLTPLCDGQQTTSLGQTGISTSSTTDLWSKTCRNSESIHTRVTAAPAGQKYYCTMCPVSGSQSHTSDRCEKQLWYHLHYKLSSNGCTSHRDALSLANSFTPFPTTQQEQIRSPVYRHFHSNLASTLVGYGYPYLRYTWL